MNRSGNDMKATGAEDHPKDQAALTRRDLLGWSPGLLGAGMLLGPQAFAVNKDAKGGGAPTNPILTGPGLQEIPPVETHLIRSRHVQQTFKVQVMRPARKKGSAERFPVVYVTD